MATVLPGVQYSNMDLLMRMYPTKKVVTQISKKTKIHKIFPREKRAIQEGEKFAIPIETQLSDAGGHRDEDDDVPVADRVRGQFGYGNYPIYERTVALTGKSMVTGGSVVDPLQREMKGLIDAVKIDTERDLFLSARGEHATVVDATDATTLVVDTGQYLTVGMRVDVLILTSGSDGDAGITNSEITAISVDKDTFRATLTLATALKAYASVDTTYGVFRHNEYGKKGWSILDAVSTTDPSVGDYLEIDRTTLPAWQCYALDADGQSASGKLFAAVQTDLMIDSDEMAGVIFCHPYVENDLIHQGVNDRLYLKTMKFELWGERVTVGGVPVVGTKYCPYKTALFLNLEYWKMAYPPKVNPEGQWAMDGGLEGTKFDRIAKKWAYEALWVRLRQLCCTRPNAQGIVTNLAAHYQGTVA